MEQDPWRGTAEAAERLGVSESQVRILIRTGRLAGRRHTVPRGRWQIRESEIMRYLAEDLGDTRTLTPSPAAA